MHKSALLRFAILLAILIGIAYAVWATSIEQLYLTVDEAAALKHIPRDDVRISGWIDPDSVVDTPEGVRFDLLSAESPDATRLTVHAGPTALDSEGWHVRECIVDGRLGDGELHAHGVMFKQGGLAHHVDAPRAYDINKLTLEPKEDQLSRLLGREVTLERAEEWLDIATYPASAIEIYYDDEGVPWIWNMGLNTWTGALSGFRERSARQHPGEASLEECLERADVLAKEYYLGDKDTFFDLRSTWTRRENTNTFPDGREVTIVSYDVMYERYVQGIRVPDLISVTVYALSGGSDFVGVRISDEITFTMQPRVTPVEADAAVRRAAGSTRLHQSLGLWSSLASDGGVVLPADASLSRFELLVWGDVLHWRLEYDWDSEPPSSGTISMCDHTDATYCVDASTGEVIPTPIREDAR